MNNRETVSSGKMSAEIIGNNILLGIPFSIISSVVQGMISNIFENIWLAIIATVAAQAIIVYVLWKITIENSFKKKTIVPEDIKKVMRNIIIYVVISIVISVGLNYYELQNNIKETMESSVELKIYDSYASMLYNEEQLAEYQKAKMEALNKVISQLKVMFFVLQSLLAILNLGILVVVKKKISEQLN